jgi:chromosome segregation ATPase
MLRGLGGLAGRALEEANRFSEIVAPVLKEALAADDEYDDYEDDNEEGGDRISSESAPNELASLAVGTTSRELEEELERLASVNANLRQELAEMEESFHASSNHFQKMLVDREAELESLRLIRRTSMASADDATGMALKKTDEGEEGGTTTLLLSAEVSRLRSKVAELEGQSGLDPQDELDSLRSQLAAQSSIKREIQAARELEGKEWQSTLEAVLQEKSSLVNQLREAQTQLQVSLEGPSAQEWEAKLNTLLLEKSSVTDELKEARDQLEAILGASQHKEWQSKVNALLLDKSSLAEELQEARAQLQRWQEAPSPNVMQSELDALLADKSKLEEDLRGVRTQLQSLQQVTASKNVYDSQEASLISLQKLKDENALQIEMLTADVEGLRSRAQASEETVTRLQSDLNAAQAKLTSSLVPEGGVEMTEGLQQIASLEAANMASLAEADSLRVMVGQLQEMIQKQRSSLDYADAREKELSSQLTSIKAAESEVRTSLALLEQDRLSLQGQLEQSQAAQSGMPDPQEIFKLQHQLESLKAQSDAASLQVSRRLLSIISKLELPPEISKSDDFHLDAVVGALEAAQAAGLLSARQALGEVQILKDQLSSISAEVSSKDRTILQLRQVIEQMRQASRTSAESKTALQLELDQARTHEAELTTEIKGLRREISQYQRYRQDAESTANTLVALKQERDDAQLSIATLTGDLDAARAECQASLREAQEVTLRAQEAQADLALAVTDRRQAETALGNLQDVLEQFQHERQGEREAFEEMLEREKDKMLQEQAAKEALMKEEHATRLQAAIAEAQRDVMAARAAEAKSAADLSRAANEIARLRAGLDQATLALRGGEDESVDRQLVANLVVRYISTRHDRRVLELMSRMFGFTEQDKEAVGLVHGKHGAKFVSGLLHALVGDGEDQVITSDEIKGESLGDAWLNFLMAASADKNETTPPLPRNEVLGGTEVAQPQEDAAR